MSTVWTESSACNTFNNYFIIDFKIYYSIKGADKDAAEKKLEEIPNTIQTKLGLK